VAQTSVAVRQASQQAATLGIRQLYGCCRIWGSLGCSKSVINLLHKDKCTLLSVLIDRDAASVSSPVLVTTVMNASKTPNCMGSARHDTCTTYYHVCGHVHTGPSYISYNKTHSKQGTHTHEHRTPCNGFSQVLLDGRSQCWVLNRTLTLISNVASVAGVLAAAPGDAQARSLP